MEQLFRTFDQDNNGHIDFHVQHVTILNVFIVTRNIQEFLKLTEFAERGSIKEKLAWTFKLYDKDMSGGGNTFLVDNEGWPYVTRNHNCQRNAGGDRDSDYHGGAK